MLSSGFTMQILPKWNARVRAALGFKPPKANWPCVGQVVKIAGADFEVTDHGHTPGGGWFIEFEERNK